MSYRQKKTQERGGAADVGNSGGKFGTSRDQLSNIFERKCVF